MKYRKSLGQHILHDYVILKKIADALGNINDETIVEIGGGTGNLTGILSQSKKLRINNLITASQCVQQSISSGESKRLFAKRLIVYEIDKNLADNLRIKFPNAEIINKDFLEADLGQYKNNYLLIGNIPYFITGRIFRKILTLENYPKIAVLTIAKEQGGRFLGINPRKSVSKSALIREYGNFWSNWLKVWAKIEKICTIKAGSFSPPPQIDSIAIKISFYKKPLVAEPENFAKFLKILFNRPKQTIYNNLKSEPIAAYTVIGSDLRNFEKIKKLRPHQLTFDQILELYKYGCRVSVSRLINSNSSFNCFDRPF
jgi:16S rRNA (adenine1518-N6/adenine1519-N6)-dimethyltransferase